MIPEPSAPANAEDQDHDLEEPLPGMEEELDRVVEANRLLRESDRQSRAWLEHSPVCTKVLDLDFNLKYMSTAGVCALQLEDAEHYYCKPYPPEFFPEGFRESMLDRLQHVRGTGEIAYQEAPIITLGGVEKWFGSTIVPVLDDDGKMEYILVVSIDITDRLRAEEHRVELERQMQHAQKLESLGVLSGGIAHDFNNLLMSVLGNADLAMQSLPADHPARGNLMEIENATRRGADLAEQMLAYSGRGKFVIEPILLRPFVDEMMHLLEVTLSKKTDLKLEVPEDLPTFDGDATQIRQVLMNLITNASESLGDGCGTIHITAGCLRCDRAYLHKEKDVLLAATEEPLPEGPYVYFEVSDDGCGMDDMVRSKIFEPFFTTKFTGRGLGMSAVLGIVRGHQGTIRITSTPGKGSSFRVLFPASRIQGQAPGLPDGAIEGSSPGEEAWSGSGTVLIADDEACVLAVGREMLHHLGFEVLAAADGRQAVDTFQVHAEDIDCVLLDLTMPELGGEQVIQELQRLQPEVRIILTSGYNLQDVSERFRCKGLAGFLQKPFDLVALRNELAKALSASRGTPARL